MTKKAVVEVQVTGIEFVGFDQELGGAVRIMFETPTQYIATTLPPAVLATLETRLEQVREAMAKRTPRQ